MISITDLDYNPSVEDPSSDSESEMSLTKKSQQEEDSKKGKFKLDLSKFIQEIT